MTGGHRGFAVAPGHQTRCRPVRPNPAYAPIIATHYDVLGLRPDASVQEIRDAYRARARRHHPDRTEVERVSSAVGSPEREMSAINEAYRVLGDPGRRAVYDRSLRSPEPATRATAVDEDAVASWTAADLEPHHSRLSPAGPARLPWKMMLVVAVLGSAVILVAAAFNDPPSEEVPDGILRVGSCIAIETNNMAREIACTNTEDDLVVDLVLPTDATCPFPLLPHIDRLGLGLACVAYD